MATYITELNVSLDDADEQNLKEVGFTKLDINLNINGRPKVYIWYKENSGNNPITRIQLSFTDSMVEGLNSTGFEKVDKNLNIGKYGDNVFLWYFRGTTESHVPITQIEVTHDDEPKKFASGWERMSCNLNRSTGGFRAFLWLKREKKTYIQDMKVTDDYDNDGDYFKNGYIRVDESTNRSTSGKPVFLWYLPTIKKEGCYVALRVFGGLEVGASNKAHESSKPAVWPNGFLPVTPPVNLNEGNQGNIMYLWYKQKDFGQNAIQTITLLSNMYAIDEYKKAGLKVCSGNLNTGEGSPCFPATPLYLAYDN